MNRTFFTKEQEERIEKEIKSIYSSEFKEPPSRSFVAKVKDDISDNHKKQESIAMIIKENVVKAKFFADLDMLNKESI